MEQTKNIRVERRSTDRQSGYKKVKTKTPKKTGKTGKTGQHKRSCGAESR